MQVCMELLPNSNICCDTVTIRYGCNKLLKEGGIFPNPGDGIVNVRYEFYGFSVSPMLLNIDIYNRFGIKQMNIMSATPTMLTNTIPVNVSSMLSGTYYIIFQYGNQIEIVQFIKTSY
jgi:hypothetical protein